MSRVARACALLALIAVTISCDRVTKHLAATRLWGTPAQSYFSGTVRLEYAENAGGFLSLGATWPMPFRTALFTVGAGGMLVIALAIAIRQRLTGWPLVGVGLACAGGVSNLIDRIVRGSVIDFMNVGVGPLRTGIFNVADVAVLAGVLVIVIAHHRSS
jgi:signal peptidase II